MPELGPKNLSFIRKVKSNFESKTPKPRSYDPAELKKLAEDYGEKYVGHGHEVVAVLHKDKPESGKLAAFNYRRDIGPETAKSVFYIHRILSVLFPHNFPHFYASMGKDPNHNKENVSGTIRQEIKTEDEESGKVLYPFVEASKICSELGIHFSIDIGSENWRLGSDGGEYYLDTLDYASIDHGGLKKIVRYMKKKKYSENDIKIVQTSVERFHKCEYDRSMQKFKKNSDDFS